MKRGTVSALLAFAVVMAHAIEWYTFNEATVLLLGLILMQLSVITRDVYDS